MENHLSNTRKRCRDFDERVKIKSLQKQDNSYEFHAWGTDKFA